MWRTCLHQSHTLFFLKDALRHCVKQSSEQKALQPVVVFNVNSFMPTFWHQAHRMQFGGRFAESSALGLESPLLPSCPVTEGVASSAVPDDTGCRWRDAVRDDVLASGPESSLPLSELEAAKCVRFRP